MVIEKYCNKKERIKKAIDNLWFEPMRIDMSLIETNLINGPIIIKSCIHN